MTRYYTFYLEHNTFHHDTLAFRPSGIVERLSHEAHEGAKMNRTWDAIGTWGDWPETHVVWTVPSRTLDMVSVALKRAGYTLFNAETTLNWGAIGTIQCRWHGTRLLTDPDTLMGRGRNKDADADRNAARIKNVDMAAAMAARRA